MPRTSKAKQEANLQMIVREHVVGGKTQGEVAKQLGVTRQTVNENLMKSGMVEDITSVARAELVAELNELKEEVKLHRRGADPLPLAAVDRLIKIAEVLAKVQLPTRSESVHVNVEADPAKLVGYRKFLYHTRHLSEEDVNRLVYPYCDSLPPTHEPNVLLGEVTDEKL